MGFLYKRNNYNIFAYMEVRRNVNAHGIWYAVRDDSSQFFYAQWRGAKGKIKEISCRLWQEV